MRFRSLTVSSALVLLLAGLVAVPSAQALSPIVPGREPLPVGGTNVAGAGINALNENAQLAETIPATIKPGWAASPPLCPSAAGSNAASISVAGTRTIVVDRQYQCSYVSAYDTATGALLWRRNYHFAQSARIDGSRIFVPHDIDGWVVTDALDLATGKVLWTAPTGNEYTVTVGGGLVMSHAWAADMVTGAKRLEIPLGSNGARTFIFENKIYSNSGWDLQARTLTGQLLWTFDKAALLGTQGSNSDLSMHNGLLYVHSLYWNAKTLVINPATGKLVRTLPSSTSPIAFDGNTGIFTKYEHNEPSLLFAVDLTTGETHWTYTLPDMGGRPSNPLSLAPIISNGLVWTLAGNDTATPGQLIALDEITGAQKSSTQQSCPVAIGNLAIAQKRIFTPSSCGVLTYTASTSTAPTPQPPAAPVELLPDPGFESTNGGWKAFTTGTLTRVTTPIHGGKGALKVTAASITSGLVGLTQNTAVASATQGKTYTASCWVRPSSSGLTVVSRILQYAADMSSNTKLVTKTQTQLPANTWTKITVTGTATKTGTRIIPQIYSINQTTTTGSITYDDCSLTRN
ncbi:outer membrane protein assembly factor BamB family protein [Arthrobacter sp. TmT3-37]